MQHQRNNLFSKRKSVVRKFLPFFNSKAIPFLLTMFLIGLSYFGKAQSVTGVGTNGTCPASASITGTASGFAGNANMGYQLFQGSTQIRPTTVGQFQTTNIFGSLSAGTYIIKAKDQNSSVTATSANVTVTISYVPMSLSNALVYVRCFGASTGQITTTVTGGSSTKSYSLTGPVNRTSQSSNIFSNLPAGSYAVAVTDACSQTVAINSSIALDTLSVNAIKPASGFGITYATLGNCSSGLVVRQGSFAAYNTTGLVLNAADFARFTWKYEYPAGSGNLYGAGGVLNAAGVPLNNATNSSIPMPGGVTAAGKAIQPTNVIIYDECGNNKMYSAAITYSAALTISNCAGVINILSVISGTGNFQPICLPVNFTFTDKASPFTVFNSQQTTVQQNLIAALVPGHSYTATGIDATNGNTVYTNTNLVAPAVPAQTAVISFIADTCQANRSILRVAIRNPSPTTAQTFTITSAPAAAGLSLPATYTLNTSGGFYPFPGTFPDGSYTVQVQTDCNNFSRTGTITGHTVSLTQLNTITNCGSFNLNGAAIMDNYALYELIILAGSSSNIGLIRSFNSNGTSLPFTGLSYGSYNIGIRQIGKICILNSLIANFTAPASPIDISSATGYVCNTSPSTTATLIVDAVSNLNSSLYYSIDDGATYGAAGVKSFTVAYGADGAVKVKVKDDCGNIASYSGNLVLPPAARATANSLTDSVIICTGSPVQLNVNVTNATYSWTGPNEFTSSLNSPTIPSFTAGNNGTYTVTATTTCGAQASSVIITAAALPTISQTMGTATACQNNTTQLTNATEGGVWSSSNTSVATVSNMGLVSGIAAGNAIISYTTAANGNGCTNATVTNIIINPLPLGVITGTTSVNKGSAAPSVTFTGSNGTAPFVFRYNINGGNPITINTTSGNSVSVTQPTTAPGTFVYNLLSTTDNSSTACNSVQTGSAAVTVNAILPITLMSFEGHIQGAYVQLNWTTAREINNNYFEVERSADGIIFTKIGTVTGNGNSLEKHDYQMLDMAPLNSESYYRLKQFDIDKNWTVSYIISVKFSAISGIYLAPNPASTIVKIKSPAGIISLIDMNGKRLLNGERTTGDYDLNVTGYPGGSYLIQVIQDNGKINTLKLQVRK